MPWPCLFGVVHCALCSRCFIEGSDFDHGPKTRGYDIQSCRAKCKGSSNRGVMYKYFALQNGDVCYCGVNNADLSQHAQRPDRECHTVLPYRGGVNRNAVFKIAITTAASEAGLHRWSTDPSRGSKDLYIREGGVHRGMTDATSTQTMRWTTVYGDSSISADSTVASGSSIHIWRVRVVAVAVGTTGSVNIVLGVALTTTSTGSYFTSMSSASKPNAWGYIQKTGQKINGPLSNAESRAGFGDPYNVGDLIIIQLDLAKRTLSFGTAASGVQKIAFRNLPVGAGTSYTLAASLFDQRSKIRIEEAFLSGSGPDTVWKPVYATGSFVSTAPVAEIDRAAYELTPPLNRDTLDGLFNDFNTTFHESPQRIIRRQCGGCKLTHRDIYFKDTLAKNEGVDMFGASKALFEALFEVWDTAGVIKLKTHGFELYSSLDNAQDGVLPWVACGGVDHTCTTTDRLVCKTTAMAFPGECGPVYSEPGQWNSASNPAQQDIKFSVYMQKGQRTECEQGSPAGCFAKAITFGSGGKLVHIQGGLPVTKSNQVNSCPAGWKIFSPKSEEEWKSICQNTTGLCDGTIFTVDVTKDSDGGSYTSKVMQSENFAEAEWKTSDGSDWWLRNTSYSEPNGDYTASCFLTLQFEKKNDVSSIRFDDVRCAYQRTFGDYYCQKLAAPTTTATTTSMTTSTSASSTPTTTTANAQTGGANESQSHVRVAQHKSNFTHFSLLDGQCLCGKSEPDNALRVNDSQCAEPQNLHRACGVLPVLSAFDLSLCSLYIQLLCALPTRTCMCTDTTSSCEQVQAHAC